jgi:hypothetical protein
LKSTLPTDLVNIIPCPPLGVKLYSPRIRVTAYLTLIRIQQTSILNLEARLDTGGTNVVKVFGYIGAAPAGRCSTQKPAKAGHKLGNEPKIEQSEGYPVRETR